MKKIILLLVVGWLAIGPSEAQGALQEIWNQANDAYTNGDYPAAIAGYDSIAREGYVSDRLYYNLGNAYFKNNQIGKAVLSYNRAQRLSPGDEDIRHNLRVANAYVKDRIEAVPEFFLASWLRSLMHTMASNTWAVMSLLFLALALCGVAFFLLSADVAYRKAGFYGGIVCLFLFVVSVVFSSLERSKILHPDEAVVMLASAPVKSSPDHASKDLFILHEGTKVSLGEQTGEWCEIRIADGNKGWIEKRAIELID